MANRPDVPRNVAAIVAAAGSGSRLGGVPKQFRAIGGRSLLYRTLEALCAAPDVTEAVVVARKEDIDQVRNDIASIDLATIAITAGGATRQESVRLGLACLSTEVDIVLVHDAARPFVSATAIRDVIRAARSDGAASVALSVADTLRIVEGEYFARTVSRDGVYRMQTPQAFDVERLIAAHQWAAENGWIGTDDVELVMAHGGAVRVVPGQASNFKITTSEDWQLAERFWPVWDSWRSEND